MVSEQPMTFSASFRIKNVCNHIYCKSCVRNHTMQPSLGSNILVLSYEYKNNLNKFERFRKNKGFYN